MAEQRWLIILRRCIFTLFSILLAYLLVAYLLIAYLLLAYLLLAYLTRLPD